MTPRISTLAFVVAALCLSCGDTPLPSAWIAPGTGVEATVQFLNLEGGCWTITTDQRVHYEPLNLPSEYKQDGLRVQVDFIRRDDFGSVCQVGPIIEIRSIRVP